MQVHNFLLAFRRIMLIVAWQVTLKLSDILYCKHLYIKLYIGCQAYWMTYFPRNYKLEIRSL